MILENDYFWFKGALTDDQCDEIIMRGEREMKRTLDAGGSLDATTFGRNDKAGLLESGADEKELIALQINKSFNVTLKGIMYMTTWLHTSIQRVLTTLCTKIWFLK